MEQEPIWEPESTPSTETTLGNPALVLRTAAIPDRFAGS